MTNTLFFIAEAGVNHNGNLQQALDLCSIALDSGADAVKFQTWQTELLASQSSKQASYQTQNTGVSRSQFALLKELELSYSSFELIKNHCDKIGIQFLSTPDEEVSLRYLVNDLGLTTIKVGSGEVTNLPFLKLIGKLADHVILSTGMSNLSDVALAINALNPISKNSLSILHCTSSYPCPPDQVNLNVIPALASILPYKIGYSDHTLGIHTALAAVAMGAKILEKHFTFSKTSEGPDHLCSLEPNELALLISGCREVLLNLGSSTKSIQPCEVDSSNAVQKTITAKVPIKSGETLTPDNLLLLRTGEPGLTGHEWSALLGCSADRDYAISENISPLIIL